MQKQIKIFSTLLTVLVLAVACSSPNNPITGTDNANFSKLKKSWIDSYKSVYSITENSFESTWLNGSTYEVSYKISIEKIAWNSDNASGIIYGKYTVNNNNPNYVGKYYAISFKGLADSKVSISGASKNIGTTEKPIYDSSAETLDDAKTKFTETNGYFGYYSDCTAVK